MISLIKPLTDSVSTASIAWATFGIVGAAVGLEVASVGAMVLGITCIGLFAVLAIPIFHYTYTSSQAENNKLEKEYAEELNNLKEFINLYFYELIKEFIMKNKILRFSEIDTEKITEHLLKKVDKHIKKVQQAQKNKNQNKEKNINTNPIISLLSQKSLITSIIKQSVNLLKECRSDDVKPFIQHEKTPLTKDFLNTTISHAHKLVDNLNKSPIPKPKPHVYFFSALTGFCGGFGTIVGGAAGIGGLLSGLGVFAGFAAIPIVGWSILGAAMILGIGLAVMSCYLAHQKHQLNMSIAQNKEPHILLQPAFSKLHKKNSINAMQDKHKNNTKYLLRLMQDDKASNFPHGEDKIKLQKKPESSQRRCLYGLSATDNKISHESPIEKEIVSPISNIYIRRFRI